MMTRDQREELKALSKELFGTTGKWRKILEKGKIVNDKQVKLKTAHKKSSWNHIEHHTFDTLKGSLLKLKEERAEMLKKMKDSVDSK